MTISGGGGGTKSGRQCWKSASAEGDGKGENPKPGGRGLAWRNYVEPTLSIYTGVAHVKRANVETKHKSDSSNRPTMDNTRNIWIGGGIITVHDGHA